MLQENTELARDWEDKLRDLIEESYYDEDEEEYYDNVTTETFEQAGLLTRDNGIVIYVDGSEIRLTIQAYSRR